MNNLSKDIITSILHYLDSIKIIKLRTVSKLFLSHTESNNLWRLLHDKIFGLGLYITDPCEKIFFYDSDLIKNMYAEEKAYWAIQTHSISLLKKVLGESPQIQLPNHPTLIYEAVRSNNIDTIILLIEHDYPVMDLDLELEYHALNLAVSNDNLDICKLLIDNGFDPNMKSLDGWCPLILAVKNGYYDITKYLCDLDIDLKIEIENHSRIYDALNLAAEIGRADIINLLLAKGLDYNHTNSHGVTILHSACAYGKLDFFESLMDGRDIYALTKNGNSMLHMTSSFCANGSDIINYLLTNYKFNINSRNKSGFTPIACAVRSDFYNNVKLLLDKNADVNITTNWNETVFYISCSKGNIRIARLLLEKNPDSDVNIKTNYDSIPLYVACQNGYMHIVKLLLDNMVNINAISYRGYNAISIACKKSLLNYDIVKILCKNGADLNHIMPDDQTIIDRAVLDNRIQIVKLLCKYKADINLQLPAHDNMSPLMIACINGRTECAKILLDNGANTELLNTFGDTCLFAAIEYDYSDLIELLHHNKADFSKLCKNVSPLERACIRGSIKCFKTIINLGLDTWNEYKYALHWSSGAGHHSFVKYLLSLDMNINKKRFDEKYTPIFIAIIDNKYDIVKLLLENGADINIRNSSDESPIIYCCKKNDLEGFNLLLDTRKISTCDWQDCHSIAKKNNYVKILDALSEY